MIVDITELVNNRRQSALIDKARWKFRLPKVGRFIGIVDNVDGFRKLVILVVASCPDAPFSTPSLRDIGTEAYQRLQLMGDAAVF